MTDKKAEMIKKTFKWIGLLPVVIIAYFLSKILSNWGFSYYDPGFVHDIATLGGFGGHYILGPIFLFQREATAIGLAIFAGIYIAPSYKKIVYFILLGVWVIFLIISAFGIGLTLGEYQWTKELIATAIVETIAQIVGVIACGFYVWEYEKEKIKNNIT
jgi:hypothetical protein